MPFTFGVAIADVVVMAESNEKEIAGLFFADMPSLSVSLSRLLWSWRSPCARTAVCTEGSTRRKASNLLSFALF